MIYSTTCAYGIHAVCRLAVLAPDGYARIRERFLEHVNSDSGLLLPQAKYDVARQLAGGGMRSG